MINEILIKILIILLSVLIIIKLYSFAIIAKSEKFKIKKDRDFEAFKVLRSGDNICSKPFRPTCNRDRIYSKLRFLEDKIDEIEYKIYRKQMEKRKAALQAEGRRRAKKVKGMISKNRIEAEKDRKVREQKANALANKRTVMNARNMNERAAMIKSLQNYPGVKHPPKLPSFASQAANSPVLSQAKGSVNKAKGEINKKFSGKKNKQKRENAKKDIKDAQSKIDTPSEFVL